MTHAKQRPGTIQGAAFDLNPTKAKKKTAKSKKGNPATVTPAEVRGKLHEIARRWAWGERQEKGTLPHWKLIVLMRLRELEALLHRRYGLCLPDDDAGRDDLLLVAHHIAGAKGNVVRHIVAWASLWAPWLPTAEAEAMAERVADSPTKYEASTLGQLVRLTSEERRELRITTIRAFDVTKRQMTENRKMNSRERSAQWRAKLTDEQREFERWRARVYDTKRRQNKGAKPRAKSLNATKPWEAEGVSRRTYFRRRGTDKPEADAGTVSCVRSRSLRSLLRTQFSVPPAARPQSDRAKDLTGAVPPAAAVPTVTITFLDEDPASPQVPAPVDPAVIVLAASPLVPPAQVVSDPALVTVPIRSSPGVDMHSVPATAAPVGPALASQMPPNRAGSVPEIVQALLSRFGERVRILIDAGLGRTEAEAQARDEITQQFGWTYPKVDVWQGFSTALDQREAA